MRSVEEIEKLLDQLEDCIADDLEAQDLDFKEWTDRSFGDNIKLIIKMAICMANGGGGHIVFGVADKVQKRRNAIRGVPVDLDLYELQKRVYEKTDPHLLPTFKEITVPEGTGTLLIVSVTGEMAPHTNTDGSATIRKGKDCIPLTGSLRKEMVGSSVTMDVTSEIVPEDWTTLVSATAIEKVREKMAEANAPEDLLSLKDFDLLNSIGALNGNYFTKGGLLIFGKSDAIQRLIPQYRWAYRRMLSDTDYIVRDDGYHPIPIAVHELERYLATDNPIMTVESGLFHHEFSTYPKIAIREALLNAFTHRDYRIHGAVMLKQYKDKLILTNPGTFMEGINPNNIVHHPSVPRNHHLMELLDRLHLVNRSNMGVPRIYRSLLVEGKEPPSYREVGNSIELSLIASSLFPGFKKFIADLSSENIHLDVDELLVLQYLLRHEQIDTSTAARVAQRNHDQARELLSKMTNESQLLEAVGRGKGRYYTLSKTTSDILKEEMSYERQITLDEEAVKMRILTLLKEQDLTNQEIRRMTGWNRKKVYKVITELESEGVQKVGWGRSAVYTLKDK
ncbi:RNA-binding domain-containing protein [Bacillus sp. FJAT-42315]|uniref:RNA-binding domain-containing protein n=1 Tax=Bacillus sp. FJAT-42315 TaxID=2014077 RepID=UPI000C24E110|nr:RNA-binding domain-containing protein [Bacillus sp. FJAT-42315]